MSFELEPALCQSLLPRVTRSERSRLLQQPMLFLLLGQPRELGVQSVVRVQERLLPVENGRIGAVRIFVTVQLAGSQREPHATEETRMRVGLEIR
jgi:hypothetical protein